MKIFWVASATLAACIGQGWAVHAQTVPVPVGMGFDAALQQMRVSSGTLRAAESALKSKVLQGEGLAGLGGPSVSLSGAAYAYNATLDVNLDPVNQRLAQLGQRLQAPLASLPIALPALPSLPNRLGPGAPHLRSGYVDDAGKAEV